MNLQAIGIEAAELVRTLDGILISICQLLALLVIFIGVSRGLVIYLKSPFAKTPLSQAFQKSRLMMGYSFSLALSFLVGATILKTMVSSQWEAIARLAVIIAVRTVLNYLLLRAINSSDDSAGAASGSNTAPTNAPLQNLTSDRDGPQSERVQVPT
ncbi:DUF1622 domain-containing protein [Egbenema bharatensis]|uniref:DUF1622 domain-containing protein n=1 Tax=Egbenema bharatensis TaxID=3463334 RepID=UPI003A8A2F28